MPGSAQHLKIIDWKQSLESLQHELDSQVYSAFIAPLSVSEFDEEKFEFIIKAPSKFICDHIENSNSKISSKIESALSSNLEQLGIEGMYIEIL